jgi:hypothetical protein
MAKSSIGTSANWSELLAAPSGKIFVSEIDNGLRFVIVRGPAALCAYVGLPEDHPLAGFSNEDINVNAHGGLTYAGAGDGVAGRVTGWFWYGWDYAHAGDASFYDAIRGKREDETRWDVAAVVADSQSTLDEFRRLANLAESIAKKARA